VLSQEFTVTGEHTGTLNLSFGSGDLVSVLGSGFKAILEVSDGAGGWTPVDSGSVGGGLLDLLGLFSPGVTTAKIEGLAAGEYRFTLAMDPALVAVGATATAQLSVDNVSLVDFTATGGEVSGNVIIDDGFAGAPDSPGTAADATVDEVNGVVINPVGSTVVHGLYGDLTIFANGDYSYTPSGDAANIGKVDAFVYQLATAAGGTASATLYVRIDSTDSTVTWSPADPSAPGVVALVASDDIGTAQIDVDVRVVIDDLVAIQYFGPGLLGTVTPHDGESFTVASGTTAELVVNSSGSTAVTTIVLQTFNGTAWVNVPGQSTTAATHTFTLGEGEYRLSSSTAKAVLGTEVTVSQTLVTTYPTEFVTGAATAATGNVLLISDHSVPDSIPSTLTVLSVLINGVYVIPGQTGAVVQGQFGTLTLHADGDYSYTPTPGLALADVGKVDSFTYKLTTPGGQEDTATLYVRLDSPDLDLVWDDANPGNPATEAPGFAAAAFEQEPSSATITEGADGADHIAIHDTEFAAVDGGDGFDTLVWDGGDATINLSLLVGKVSDIESIDLNDFSAVDLTVSLEDLLAVTAPETDRLFIQGDEQDSVHLTGNWSVGSTQLENGQEYVVYTSQEDETHQLWVQSGVNVV
jgi:hypothetical protein